MASNLFGRGSLNSFNRSGHQPQTPSMGRNSKHMPSSCNVSSMKRPHSRRIGVNQPSRLQHVQENRLFASPTGRDVTKNDRNRRHQVAPPSFPTASIQEAETDNRFIDVEMSQLTMSQSSFMEHQDTLSHRSSSQSSSKPPVTFPPLHQSSAASSQRSSFAGSNPHSTASNTSQGLGNIIPAALLRNVSTTPFKNPVVASSTVATSVIRTPSLMIDNQSRDDRSVRSMGHQSLIDPSKSRLRMTNAPRRVSNDNHSGGPVLMRFRHASSKSNSIFTQRSLSQPSVDDNSANLLPSNQAQPSHSKPPQDFEKRLKDAHEELKAQVSEQIQQQLNDMKKDMHSEFAKFTDDNEAQVSEKIAQATNTNIQKLDSAAKGHLAAMSKSAEASISKIGEIAKATKDSIMNTGGELVNAALPLLHDPIKSMVDMFVTLSDKHQNAPPVSHQAISSTEPTLVLSVSAGPRKNNRTKTQKETKRANEAVESDGAMRSKRRRIASLSQETPSETDVTQPSKPPVEQRRNLRSQRQRIASLSQEAAFENDAPQTSKPPMEGRPKGRRKHSKDRSEKEAMTPVSKIAQSFVTPCKKLSEEQVSTAPIVSLAKTKSTSGKQTAEKKSRKRRVSPLRTRSNPQADLSQYLIPTEVLLTSPVGSTSPLSIPPLPRVEENECKSPVSTKRRARRAPPQLKITRVKRSRTYGSDAWKKADMQDDSFTFL
jgi:hypothetical protein